MTVRAYYSTDASAPAMIANVAGQLIAVLDACLVNGYGAKAGAGWSKAYSGTNKAAYRTGTGSNQRFMRVDDTGTTSARAVGYESMSDVDTGTNAFPTNTQVSGGLHFQKSGNSTARPWAVFATEAFVYIYIGFNQTALDTSSSGQSINAFGDFPSFVPSDSWNTIILGDTSAGSTSSNFGTINTATVSGITGAYIARGASGTAGAVNAGRLHLNTGGGPSTIGGGGMTYPSAIHNGMELKTIFVAETGGLRGFLPGAWSPNHNLPGNHFDTLSGTGFLSGKTFLLMDCASGGTRGRVAIETSDTW